MTTIELASIIAAGTAVTLAPIPAAAIAAAADLFPAIDGEAHLDAETADLLAQVDRVDATIRRITKVLAAGAGTDRDWTALDQAREARGRLEDWLLADFTETPRQTQPVPAAAPAAALTGKFRGACPNRRHTRHAYTVQQTAAGVDHIVYDGHDLEAAAAALSGLPEDVDGFAQAEALVGGEWVPCWLAADRVESRAIGLSLAAEPLFV